MRLVKSLEQYDSACIFFCDSIKNNVMHDGNFIRVIYSNSLFVLNGVHLYFTVTPLCIEKCHNKYKIIFDKTVDQYIIDRLKYVEENIVNKVRIARKEPQYKITDQLQSGSIKISLDDDSILLLEKTTIILKISGIWETDFNYGITYRFSKG